MEQYAVSRIFPQERERVYALVADIEKYPQFVPGYKTVQVRKRGDDRLWVRQTVSVLGWEATFDSLARLDPPYALVIEASPRGFRMMHIEWHFDSLGREGTRIDVGIRYAAKGHLLTRFSRPWVKAFIEMQIRAFRRRADASQRDGLQVRR